MYTHGAKFFMCVVLYLDCAFFSAIISQLFDKRSIKKWNLDFFMEFILKCFIEILRNKKKRKHSTSLKMSEKNIKINWNLLHFFIHSSNFFSKCICIFFIQTKNENIKVATFETFSTLYIFCRFHAIKRNIYMKNNNLFRVKFHLINAMNRFY